MPLVAPHDVSQNAHQLFVDLRPHIPWPSTLNRTTYVHSGLHALYASHLAVLERKRMKALFVVLCACLPLTSSIAMLLTGIARHRNVVALNLILIVISMCTFALFLELIIEELYFMVALLCTLQYIMMTYLVWITVRRKNVMGVDDTFHDMLCLMAFVLLADIVCCVVPVTAAHIKRKSVRRSLIQL